MNAMRMAKQIPSRICVLLLGVTVAACGGGNDNANVNTSTTNTGSSNTTGSNIPNPYNNGFRLVKVTSDNHFSDRIDSITTYEYTNNGRQIVRTETSGTGEDTRTRSRTLETDSSGLMTGGFYTRDADTTRFKYSYDASGRLIEYDAGFYTLDFQYDTEGLKTIVDGSSNVQFTYGPDAKLVSTTDSIKKETTSFEYNVAGQVTAATVVNQFGEAGYSYAYEYDANGNLARQTQTRPFGGVFEISTYEYEPNDTPMYNHQLFRLQYQPFYNVVFSFISS